MNAKELIDKVLLYTDNTLASDAGTATRRIKYLEWAQEVFDQVWHERPWRWSMSSTALTVPAGQGYVALPADFHSVSPYGRAYNNADKGVPMDEVQPQLIQSALLRDSGVSRPSVFAIMRADDGVQRFYVQKNSPALVVTLWYKTSSPTLVDVAHATTSKLQYIPAGYHYTVILAGVKEKSARQKGDARAAADWHQIYVQGLARMVVNEVDRRSTVRRMGRAVVGMW